jgi:hypothetical protein
MQDNFLDDDFAMEHGILLDENLLGVVSDPKDESPEIIDTEDEKPYGCAVPDCTFVSSSPSLLYYHFKASHPGATTEKPFRCTMPDCGHKRYKNINGLQYHVTHAKNSPGHSGNSSGQPLIGEDGSSEQAIKSARNSLQNSSTSLGKVNNTPHSNASSPSKELQILLPTAAYDPNNVGLSTPPTPAELQLQLHQPKKDHASQLAVPLARSTFNLSHSPSPMDVSAVSSQMILLRLLARLLTKSIQNCLAS